MALKINLSEIRALSKEQRKELARVIRQQPDLYNAINGVGGLSETATNGRLQGSISTTDGPLAGADIRAEGKPVTKTVKSDQYGLYTIDLAQEVYKVTFHYGEQSSEPKEFDIRNGICTTADYQFK